MDFHSILNSIYKIVWGPLTISFVLLIGIFFTFKLKGFCLIRLPHAFSLLFKKEKDLNARGEISPFSSLMASLASTIGIGNIAGVATALTLGGAGSIFWMWMTAIFGMALKYSECVLGVKFRKKEEEYIGGPMYSLKYGVKGKKGTILSIVFACATVAAAFGMGNAVQSNTIADIFSSVWGVSPIICGLFFSVLVFLIIGGGIKGITRVTDKIVPFMSIFYICAGLFVIFVNSNNILPALNEIFTNAFSFTSAAGGIAGGTFAAALRYGTSRGVMTHESGLGSASITAACTKTEDPAKQGLIGMTATFIDTIVICTITALCILTSNVPLNEETGALLTLRAFSTVLPSANEILAISTTMFAFSSVIGWAYLGEVGMRFLLGEESINFYRVFFSVIVALSCLFSLETVWMVADIANAFMVIPNLICLILLRKVIFKETSLYKKRSFKKLL
ncbi:MAG: sodium:alanine symporter family protein [Eubacteriales bacterium]